MMCLLGSLTKKRTINPINPIINRRVKNRPKPSRNRHNLYYSPLSFFVFNRYRFMELYYKSNEVVRKDRTIPPRTETVVIYLPDIRSCVPTRLEWDALTVSYKQKLESVMAKSPSGAGSSGSSKTSSSNRKANDSKTVAGDATVKTEVTLEPGAVEELSTQLPGDVAVQDTAEANDGGAHTDDQAAKHKALHNLSSFSLSVLLTSIKFI